MNVFPTGITADKENRLLTIAWNDGSICKLSFTLLRNACPCAECRGGHENMGKDPDPVVFQMPEENNEKTRMKMIEQTGSYGLTIEWEDGHHFGIYNWQYLKALCSGMLLAK